MLDFPVCEGICKPLSLDCFFSLIPMRRFALWSLGVGEWGGMWVYSDIVYIEHDLKFCAFFLIEMQPELCK